MTNLAEQCTLFTHEIQELKKQGDTNFWRLGACLAEVADGKLHVDCGYDTFAQYLQGAVDIDERQARKWMVVAKNYGESMAADFGLERCYAYVMHTRATPEEDRPVDIARATIPSTVEGRTIRRLVRDCTVAQIEAATRAIRGTDAADVSAEVKSLIGRLQDAVAANARIVGSLRNGVSTLAITGIVAENLCDVIGRLSAAAPCP